MMTQRVMCETGIYQAAVPVSGPLELSVATCPAARGKRVLAIHGAEDKNVPIAGGRGSKGISNVSFRAEAQTQRVYEKSGAQYKLWVVPGADHKPKDIEAAIAQSGLVMQEEVVKFLGIAKTDR
jgi:poly(3-hydroxybutyrate) depolymerase